MKWWCFLRTVMAFCAIATYALPAAAHGTGGGHGGDAREARAAVPCAGHDMASQPGGSEADGTAANTAPAPASDTPIKCPGHKDGATSCCVAMCHAALTMPVISPPWPATLRAASDARLIVANGPTLISRLDRPPKARVPSHG